MMGCRASLGSGKASTEPWGKLLWHKNAWARTLRTGEKKGRKRSLLVDARGVPLSLIVTAANRNDVTELAATLDAIVVPRPPVGPRRHQHLCADAGFVGRRPLEERVVA